MSESEKLSEMAALLRSASKDSGLLPKMARPKRFSSRVPQGTDLKSLTSYQRVLVVSEYSRKAGTWLFL